MSSNISKGRHLRLILALLRFAFLYLMLSCAHKGHLGRGVSNVQVLNRQSIKKAPEQFSP